MYEFERNIFLVTIATNVSSNLALLDVDEVIVADSLAVAHRSFINVIPILNPKRRARYVSITNADKRNTERITEFKWVKLNNDSVFVVLSTMGLQVYDLQVNDVSYYHCCRETGDRPSFTKGICVVKNLLCIGTNLGAIWIFKGNENNNNFSIFGKYYAHEDAITLLDGWNEHLVSCSNDKTYIWEMKRGDMEIVRDVQVSGLFSTPSALKVAASQIFLGYESGELCIFDILDPTVNIRLVAHMLQIVAIDFSPLKYMILTASQDAYLKLWDYNQTTYEVKLKYKLNNNLGSICGAAFLTMNCSSFCISTVDCVEVQVFRLKEDMQKEFSGDINSEFEKLFSKEELKHRKPKQGDKKDFEFITDADINKNM